MRSNNSSSLSPSHLRNWQAAKTDRKTGREPELGHASTDMEFPHNTGGECSHVGRRPLERCHLALQQVLTCKPDLPSITCYTGQGTKAKATNHQRRVRSGWGPNRRHHSTAAKKESQPCPWDLPRTRPPAIRCDAAPSGPRESLAQGLSTIREHEQQYQQQGSGLEKMPNHARLRIVAREPGQVEVPAVAAIWTRRLLPSVDPTGNEWITDDIQHKRGGEEGV
ncbi:hypothetical protein LIA77_05734 [Sarocladium implicatum]|nr:hypothetical protein LIA77_05734 [Sarocladium implicatum]